MKTDRKGFWEHDWNGQCDPANNIGPWKSFSVGVFQWIPGKTKRMVKSPVKIRIKGLSSNPQAVYDEAESRCDRLDRGERIFPKYVNVEAK